MRSEVQFSYSRVFCRTPLLLLPATVVRLDVRPIGDKEVASSTPPGRQHSFVEIDHEIFYGSRRAVSVSGERMCAILVKRLED